MAVWDTEPLVCFSLSHFSQLPCDVFEYQAGGRDVYAQLIHQFCTLAAQSGWKDAVLKVIFHERLSQRNRCWDQNCDFPSYIMLTVCLDNRLCTQATHRPTSAFSTLGGMKLSAAEPEPMQVRQVLSWLLHN